MNQTEWTYHQLINPIVEIETVRTHAAATIDVVVKFSRTDARGARSRATLGGRYRLGFVRSRSGWRIDRRALLARYDYSQDLLV
ncbi:MAG: hypothetical protein VR75_09415 [Hyphomonadaceae bacterium BRH_c29]|nr:MAG: hypothetical protein VR75_09415 [Hyphomonadaceae bacterium BRH_c29]